MLLSLEQKKRKMRKYSTEWCLTEMFSHRPVSSESLHVSSHRLASQSHTNDPPDIPKLVIISFRIR